MNNTTIGIFFIVAGLLFLFHDYYAGNAGEQKEENGKELNAIDIMMGFFMLGLGGYYLFKSGG
ncbi:MAG: hypothetical protein ACE5GK_03665 [Nitrospiria bacterium]